MSRKGRLNGFNLGRRGAIDYSDHMEYLTETSENEVNCISISMLILQWILGLFFLICLGLLAAIGYLAFVLCE